MLHSTAGWRIKDVPQILWLPKLLSADRSPDSRLATTNITSEIIIMLLEWVGINFGCNINKFGILHHRQDEADEAIHVVLQSL